MDSPSVKRQSESIYLLLAGIFIAALVVCNLIANKFIAVDLGFKTFVISAGILPYPLTFLITDLLSEIYGKTKTNRVVIVGFIASIFIMGVLWLGNQFPAIENSPVNNQNYQTMFGNTWRVILASMTAYLSAQLLDVKLYHFWKNLTKGKHLWLRNNGSTIVSQLVDTTLVVLVLFYGKLSSETLLSYIIDGWLFKTICALIDTPFLYMFNFLIRKKLKMKMIDVIPS